MATILPARAPWHLWAVGVISLLWNAMGAIDYSLTELHNQAYFDMGGMTPEMIAYFNGFPAWAVAAWAIGVWSCLAGSIVLLVRSRLAAPAFALSLLGLAVTDYFSIAVAHPAAFDTTASTIFRIVLFAVTVFLTIYAWRMKAAGVLR